VLLFDWHATLVDTHDAMYYAVNDVLPRLEELGLAERIIAPEDSKTIDDAKLVIYVRQYLKLHPKVVEARKISRTDIFEILFGRDEEAKHIAHREFHHAFRRRHFGSAGRTEGDGSDARRADQPRPGVHGTRHRLGGRNRLAALFRHNGLRRRRGRAQTIAGLTEIEQVVFVDRYFNSYIPQSRQVATDLNAFSSIPILRGLRLSWPLFWGELTGRSTDFGHRPNFTLGAPPI